MVILGGVHDASLLILIDAMLEEVSLTLERNKFHPVERVHRVVKLGRSELHEESVGDEFNVRAHQVGVHADEGTTQRIAHELLLNLDRVTDDLMQ